MRRRWLLGIMLVMVGCRGTGTPALTTTPSSAGAPAGALTAIVEPDQGMAPVYQFLTSPRHTLDLTMYELVDAAAEQILAADAARGVRVRVLLDQERERHNNQAAYDFLADHGVHVAWASDAYEATHEKAAVADAAYPYGRALIMTLNLTSRYYADTRDLAVIDTDLHDVNAVASTFAADVAGTGGREAGVVAPDLIWSPGSQLGLVQLIDSARTSIFVENEEMSDRAVITALTSAAHRGVAVHVVMTADSEWDGAFGTLASAGVEVHTIADDASALYIHAKALVVDDARAFVGSENFSAASLDDNRELGLITDDPGVVGVLEEVMARDFAGAAVWPAP